MTTLIGMYCVGGGASLCVNVEYVFSLSFFEDDR